jgi:hypothetical protein
LSNSANWEVHNRNLLLTSWPDGQDTRKSPRVQCAAKRLSVVVTMRPFRYELSARTADNWALVRQLIDEFQPVKIARPVAHYG